MYIITEIISFILRPIGNFIFWFLTTDVYRGIRFPLDYLDNILGVN